MQVRTLKIRQPLITGSTLALNIDSIFHDEIKQVYTCNKGEEKATNLKENRKRYKGGFGGSEK